MCLRITRPIGRRDRERAARRQIYARGSRLLSALGKRFGSMSACRSLLSARGRSKPAFLLKRAYMIGWLYESCFWRPCAWEWPSFLACWVHEAKAASASISLMRGALSLAALCLWIRLRSEMHLGHRAIPQPYRCEGIEGRPNGLGHVHL